MEWPETDTKQGLKIAIHTGILPLGLSVFLNIIMNFVLGETESYLNLLRYCNRVLDTVVGVSRSQACAALISS